MQQIWREKIKRIWPKTGPSLPVAKRNHKGKIVSGPRDIKNLLAREYKDHLRSRPIRPDLVILQRRRKKIFQMKMKMAQRRQSPEWTMADLDLALSNLKTNKSRDPEGYVNEISKNGVKGEDMKQSLLIMMIQIKRQK